MGVFIPNMNMLSLQLRRMDGWDACCTCSLFVYSLYNVVVSAHRTSEGGLP